MSINVVKIIRPLLLLLVIVIIAGIVFVAVKFTQPHNAKGSEILFEVPAGSSTKQVAASLEQANIISGSGTFEWYLYLRGWNGKIKAGSYSVSSAMSVAEIAKMFIAGKTLNDAVKVTVVEGWKASDIVQKLRDLGFQSAGDFERLAKDGPTENLRRRYDFLRYVPKGNGLEGLFFPDTYFISKKATAEEIASRMLENFGRKITGLRQEMEKTDRSFYDTIILASIVEREVGRNKSSLSEGETEQLKQERRLVASVFANRLRAGMPLESDATLQYVTGGNSNRATYQELEIDSPYNTYRVKGLPPTPVSSPSLDSIMAALEPAQTDYFFFLTEVDGTAHFARTFEEHKQNRERYLQ